VAVPLTGAVPVGLLVGGAVLLVGLVPFRWDDWHHRRAGRTLTTLLAFLAVVLATFAVINDQADFFPTVSSLVAWQGAQLRVGRDGVVRKADDHDVAVAVAAADAARTPGHGAVLAVPLGGTASGITREGAVYLPSAYFDADGAAVRFPVLEVLSGSPGSPAQLLHELDLAQVLDTAIAQHRMAPTVVVVPDTNGDPVRDRECVDRPGGVLDDTYLTTDVPDWVTTHLRVQDPGRGWGLLGTSTGGYCAVNLLLRHPDRYAEAASLSGYFHALTDVTTGDLFPTRVLRDLNDPTWRVTHLPPGHPRLFLSAGTGEQDEAADLRTFAAVLPSGTDLTTVLLPGLGHAFSAWAQVLPQALGWASAGLPPPLAGTAPLVGQRGTAR
jgi:enterochelin esterase-like enzyme